MRFGPLIALLVIAGAGYGAWRWIESRPAQEQSGGRGRGGRFAQQRGAAVPVAVAPVKIETTPITREGIGNITAQQLVTVRAQVEGPLLSVEFTEGQTVKKGDVLARIDPTIYKTQLEQALAKKMQDEANLANARLDLQRYRALAASNAGPKQQADQQAAQVAQLTALVKADEAAVASAQTTLGYTTIASPLDGRAGLRLVDPGNIVRPGDANGLVTIAQIAPIDAVFTLPQRDLALVTAAQARGKVAVEVLGAGGGAAVASGELAAVDNAIDTSTGTIRLKATFANADRTLWPGQFVNVRVTVGALDGARVVPATAVRRGPDGTFVYVLDGEDHVATRPVVVAAQDELRAALSSGVEAGDKVVTVGFARLTPGARVTLGPDVAAPEAGASPEGMAGETRRGGRGRRGQADGAPAAPGGKTEAANPDAARPEAAPAPGGEARQAAPGAGEAARGERGGRRRGDGQGRDGQGRDGQARDGQARGEGRARRGQEAPAPAPDPAPAPAQP